jgi:hypothetical protein
VARGASLTAPVHSTGHSGDGGEDEGGGSDGGRVRRKKKKYFHGCFSTDHVQEVIATFCEKKLSILERIGLGSLTYLKPGMKHSRGLVCSLLKQIEPDRMCLILEKGGEIKLSNESVHRILGVRCEGNDINIGSALSEELKKQIHEIFSTPFVENLPTMEDAKKSPVGRLWRGDDKSR